jgi:predicted kinase
MASDARPTLIVVNGVPAAGKTTLARRLAADLRLPLLAKDGIKERLYDALGVGDRDWSMRLGAAAFRVLFAESRNLLAAGCPVVLEAYMERALGTPDVSAILDATGARSVQLYLRVDRAKMIERYEARSLRGERHPGHIDGYILERMRANAYRVFEPLDLPGDLIELDTTDFARVDYRALLAQIRPSNAPPPTSEFALALLVVTGPPASGKTTLARRLAADLAVPLVEKDAIKERLFEVLGDDGDHERSRRLGAAARLVMVDVARQVLASGRSVAVEAPLDRALGAASLGGIADATGCRLVQVVAAARADVLLARHRERAGSPGRHSAHLVPDAAELAEWERDGVPAFEPADLPCETIEVETSDFALLDYDAVLERVRAALSREQRTETTP